MKEMSSSVHEDETVNRVDKLLTIVPSVEDPFRSKFIVPRVPDSLIDDIFVENLLSYGPALTSGSKLCSYNLELNDNLRASLFMRLSVSVAEFFN
jgi:hypothetical protein